MCFCSSNGWLLTDDEFDWDIYIYIIYISYTYQYWLQVKTTAWLPPVFLFCFGMFQTFFF